MNPDANRCDHWVKLEKRCVLDKGHADEHAFVRVVCWCCHSSQGCACSYDGVRDGLPCDVHASPGSRALARFRSFFAELRA